MNVRLTGYGRHQRNKAVKINGIDTHEFTETEAASTESAPEEVLELKREVYLCPHTESRSYLQLITTYK